MFGNGSGAGRNSSAGRISCGASGCGRESSGYALGTGRPGWPGRWRTAESGPEFKTEDEGYGAIRAIDPKTGDKVWDFHMVAYTESGVLSTGSDLVLGGGQDGNFV